MRTGNTEITIQVDLLSSMNQLGAKRAVPSDLNRQTVNNSHFVYCSSYIYIIFAVFYVPSSNNCIFVFCLVSYERNTMDHEQIDHQEAAAHDSLEMEQTVPDNL